MCVCKCLHYLHEFRSYTCTCNMDVLSQPNPTQNGKTHFATVKSALTTTSENWEASYFESNAVSVFGLMYRPTSYLVKKRLFATLLFSRHNKIRRMSVVHAQASSLDVGSDVTIQRYHLYLYLNELHEWTPERLHQSK